jgi:formylglycine-generating enzyme required for sulfatase activity
MADGLTPPPRRLVLQRRVHRNQFFREPLTDSIALAMVLIPGGSFLMGSPETELDNYESEQPLHEVMVPQFFIARTPITQAQWRVVAGLPQVEQELDPNPSNFKGDNRPVERVIWDDATEFCQRLSQATGRTYRLPTEAEWEYACRAGTTTPFHFGETLGDELVNYQAEDEKLGAPLYKEVYGRGIRGKYRRETTDVGSFPANAFGLYDMHGNVWEWCEDDWHASYEGAPTDGSAWVEADRTETDRLLRGGSWANAPRNCRSASRNLLSRGLRGEDVGFRVCCEPPGLDSWLLSP